MRELFKLVGSLTIQGIELAAKGLDSIDKKVTSIVKPIDKLGKSVETVGRKFTVLTAPIAAIGAGVIALAGKTGEYAESLLNMSEVTGLSTDNLQKYKHVADLVGVSYEGLVSGAQKLTARLQGIDNEGGNAFEAIRKLGVNIHDSSGKLKSMNDLFPEVIAALQKHTDTTERNMIAQQLFGKNLKDVAPILGMSADELKRMTDEADKMGLVLSGDALKSAADFDDKMGLLKEQFSATYRNIASQFIPVLNDMVIPLVNQKVIPALQKFVDYIKSLVNWFKNLNPSLQEWILKIGAFTIVLGPVLIGLGKFISLAKTVATTITAVRTAFLALNTAFLTNPFGLAIIAAGAFTAAIYGAVNAYKDLQKEHQKYALMTAEQAKINEFTKGVDELQKKIMSLGAALNEPGKAQELLGKDFEHLSEQARGLGYVVEGGLQTRLTRLTEISNSLKGGIAELGKGFVNASKDQAGYNDTVKDTIELTKEEKEAIEKFNKTHSDAIDEIILDENELLDKQEQEALSLAKTEEGKILVQAEYYLKRKQLLEKQLAELNKDEKSAKEELEDLDKKAAEERVNINQDFNLKLAEIKKNEGKILEIQYQKDLETANKAGADITKVEEYYSLKRKELHIKEMESYQQIQISMLSSVISAAQKLGNYIITSLLDKVDKAKEKAKARLLVVTQFAIAHGAAAASIWSGQGSWQQKLGESIGVSSDLFTEMGIALNQINKYRIGTSNSRGGLALINEEGPELLNLPQGSQVIPADKTKKAIDNLANGGGGPDVHIHAGVVVADDSSMRKFARILRPYQIAENQRLGLAL